MAATNFNPYIVKTTDETPESLDWRDYGVVGIPKNQGLCGSNWAFATLGNLQSLYAIHYGTYKYFSSQMLVDCDTSDSGCNGGLMEYAYTWLKKNGGIMYDADYPYKGVKSTCKSNSSKYVNMKITGYKKLGSSWSTYFPVGEDVIKEALYRIGPLAIALNGDPLQTYTSGILDKPTTECSGINHAALLVGYGVDAKTGIKYWIIQNCWGTFWGESGYFRIRRGNGTLGFNCYVITGLVSFD